MPTQDEINRVIESTDMVDLVSPFVNLIKQGKSYKGLCPFHNEDTPSFVVSQEKHIAHCFGCGKGGNPINFLMQIKQISFNEALNELAQKNGIKLTNAVQTKKTQDYSKYYEMMHIASKFYEKNLTTTKSGLEALDYLHKRGLNDETIKMFKIGLAPFGNNALYQVLKDSNYLELDMIDIGLINHNEKGYYDLFSKRIMFPISDEMGNIIGFSGRIFNNSDPNQPKYVNTKETFLYRKGSVLYHLDLAKSEILRKKRVILHEGQMDVIQATIAGYPEAVCSMGTALTEAQASTLKKYATQAIICFDGDKAGVQASKKAISIFKRVGMNVHLVLLPNGMDPDEYIQKYGKEEYQKYFDSHILDEQQYYFETAFLNRDLNDYNDLELLKREVFDIISNQMSQTAKETYMARLAERLKISVSALAADYNSYCNITPVKKYVEFDPYEPEISINEEIKPINNQFKRIYELRLLMYARTSIEKALFIDSRINQYIDGMSSENRSLWIKLIDIYYNRYQNFDDNTFCSLLTEEEMNTYYSNMEFLRKTNDPYSDQDLEFCIDKIKEMNEKAKQDNESSKILSSLDEEVIKRSLAEKFKIKKKIDQSRRK